MISIAVAALSGCDAPDHDSDPVLEQDQPLIFGTARDVEQARGQWRHVENADSLEMQARLAQIALATRGTASLGFYGLSLHDDCQETVWSTGSGQLTSSTRLSTAFHVVSGYEGAISAYFEASMPRGVSEHTGYFVPDGDEWGSISPEDRLYDYRTKFPDAAESPFLANRIAQLGLELNSETRDFLRGPWPFQMEESDFPARLSQGRVLDYALLRAQERPADLGPHHPRNHRKYVATGGFPLRAPGVFFDYQPMQPITRMHCPEPLVDDECPVPMEYDAILWPEIPSCTAVPGEGEGGCGDDYEENGTPIWLLHNQYFPDDPFDERPRTQNLVSNPYPFIANGSMESAQKGFRLSDAIQFDMRICRPSGASTLRVGDAFDAPVDSFVGSSGGPAFHPIRRMSGETVRESRRLVGPSALFTGMLHPEEDFENYVFGWGLPLGDDYQKYMSSLNALDPLAATASRRDDTHDDEETPGNPTPVQPPDDDDPECREYFEDSRECKIYEGSLHGLPFLGEPPDDLSPYLGAPSGGVFDHSDNHEADDEMPDRWRLVSCGASHNGFSSSPHAVHENTGIGLGFIGSLRYNPDHENEQIADSGSVVGFLRMVCAPFSSVPFTVNWPLLATAGTSYRNTQNDTAIFPSRFGSLAESLSSVSEARYDWQTGEEYIRPMSMKTCPPNYFMNGFRFHLRPHPTDEERQVVAGILALSCVRSSRPYQNQDIPERLAVPLYTEEQSLLFQLGDRSFSTGQQIGWSQNPYLPDCDDTSSSSPCETTLQCALPGDVATGFAYIRDGSGMLTNIAIRCHRGP